MRRSQHNRNQMPQALFLRLSEKVLRRVQGGTGLLQRSPAHGDEASTRPGATFYG